MCDVWVGLVGQMLHARSNLIAAGDLVIVYVSHEEMKAVQVSALGKTHVRYGIFEHRDWIGRAYGTKVFSKSGSWVYILAPTPELWTHVLSHRTQILYIADCAQICAGLGLRSGRVVLESGTGSGSLTHSLARAVAPAGAVHTFEFHQQRWQEARTEFETNGLGDLVHSNHRDIEALGFPESLHGCAHAVVLDLPGPWKVVESAKACLKPNGQFCAFSPCMEQVQQTSDALRVASFTDIRCIECLLRFYDVRTEYYSTPALPKESTEVAQHGEKYDSIVKGEPASVKEAAGEDDKQQAVVAAICDAEQDVNPNGQAAADVATVDKHEDEKDGSGEGRGVKRKHSGSSGCKQHQYEPWVSDGEKLQRQVPIPRLTTKGHTGYLLFGRKPVCAADQRVNGTVPG